MYVLQLVPLLPPPCLLSREWPVMVEEALDRAVAALVEAAPVEEAPVAWTAGSALARQAECTPTPKTRISSITAAKERPTSKTVLQVWSLTPPAPAVTGLKSRLTPWQGNYSRANFRIVSQRCIITLKCHSQPGLGPLSSLGGNRYSILERKPPLHKVTHCLQQSATHLFNKLFNMLIPHLIKLVNE